MGLVVIAAPSTQAVFMAHNPAATIFLCILKTGIAGLVAGFIFKLFAFIAIKKESLAAKRVLFATGIIIAALIVPVINTGLFIVGATLFFSSIFGGFTGIINAVITTNFLIEFLVSAILSPALVTLVKVVTKQYNLGFNDSFRDFNIAYKEQEETKLENTVNA